MANIKFSDWKRDFFRFGKKIKGLCGGVGLYAAQENPQIDTGTAEKSRFRIWSPPFLQGLFIVMTGTGLLPYIRPHYKSNLISWASMKSARIVLIG